MILARIQHTPSRADLLPALLERISPLPVEVIAHSSTPPSPWAGYKLCLSDLPECSHVAILQDDTRPVDGFPEALPRIAASNPEYPVLLFHSRTPAVAARIIKHAHLRKRIYTDFVAGDFMPVVAVLWPRQKAEEFLSWALEHEKQRRRPPRSDDQMAGTWIKRTGQKVRVAVPSLVEHLGVPTTKGKANVESWRALFLADDASAYEW